MSVFKVCLLDCLMLRGRHYNGNKASVEIVIPPNSPGVRCHSPAQTTPFRILVPRSFAKLAFRSFRGTAINEDQGFVGSNELRGARPQFVENFAPLFLIE